ncbi:phosphate ABC transporter permease PstA [Nitrospira moscoviensis]|uniref:Phosphate transport system permease protein PstA n=1 Tax=Nitrospira moscoviensis TaxID=42253 RepID=A0A0K2GKD6_NITMO|nr:phosphate ABC transporter permease PstA [Nitrospira moscoviensis]ALA61092.1 Phosphate permease component of ATP-dependent phosphate uptake system [Nitrospira moscoviensis]
MRELQGHIARSQRIDRLFRWAGLGSMASAVVILIFLLGTLGVEGGRRLSWQFLTSYPSRMPAEAGILPACVGTFLVMLVTALASIPLGVAAAVYLEEYAPRNRVTALIEINIANLAGVPSIVYGLMALGLFVHQLQLGHSILTAGLTLALLCLPVVIIATREAVRTVPTAIREAAYALGATKWQTIRDHVLPYATGGILTGVIIALSRAIGETAPLITIGALSFIAFLPSSPVTADPPFVSLDWLFDPFTVLPMQIFNWVSRPQAAFHLNAAAAGLILMSVTLAMNGLAFYIRYRARRRIHW